MALVRPIPAGGDGASSEEGTGNRTPSSKEPSVSLQTIVASGLGGRLHLRRAAMQGTIAPRPNTVTVAMSGGSMRFLEAGLALTALATALLIGVGR
jgi:hypothetical protein